MSTINKSIISAPSGAKMIAVDVKQGSKKWLGWRSQGITASDIPIILGLSPYKTRWQLWAEKIGLLNSPDISNNPNVKRGHQLEDTIRQLAEKRYGEVLLPVCGEFIDWDVLRASFDGLDTNHESYEFKAPSDSIFEELETNRVNSDTYKMYEAQVHAQCVVAGSTLRSLIFYKADGSDLDFPITLTDERKDQIVHAAQEFWELVQLRIPPETDFERDWYVPVKGDQKFRWDALADVWAIQQRKKKSLQDELKELDGEQKKLQKDLVEEMGQFMQADTGGVKISRFTKQGSIDYKQYLTDIFPGKDLVVELDGYRKSSSEQTRFTSSSDTLINHDVEFSKASIEEARALNVSPTVGDKSSKLTSSIESQVISGYF